jgi:hypothetical protein
MSDLFDRDKVADGLATVKGEDLVEWVVAALHRAYEVGQLQGTAETAEPAKVTLWPCPFCQDKPGFMHPDLADNDTTTCGECNGTARVAYDCSYYGLEPIKEEDEP